MRLTVKLQKQTFFLVFLNIIILLEVRPLNLSYLVPMVMIFHPKVITLESAIFVRTLSQICLFVNGDLVFPMRVKSNTRNTNA
jgi:hypothetical protein